MDFPSVVKYLDYIPGRSITSAEADEFDGKASPLSKYQHILKTRPIKKIQVSFNLLAHLIEPFDPQFRGQMMFQYNFSFFGRLYITQVLGDENLVRGGCLTVKFRRGNIVSRYALVGNQQEIVTTSHPTTVRVRDLFKFPVYTGELIEKNCIFEFWANYNSLSIWPKIGVNSDLKIMTSRLVNPATPDELERVTSSIAAIDRANMEIAYPINLPYNQPTIVWQDN